MDEQQRIEDHKHGTRFVDDEGRCVACALEVRESELAAAEERATDWKAEAERLTGELGCLRATLGYPCGDLDTRAQQLVDALAAAEKQCKEWAAELDDLNIDNLKYVEEQYHALCNKLWSAVEPRDNNDCASIAVEDLAARDAKIAELETENAGMLEHGAYAYLSKQRDEAEQREMKATSAASAIDKERASAHQEIGRLVHQVNELEAERDRLREALQEIQRRSKAAWKPCRVTRSEDEADLDEIKHGVWQEAAEIADAALKPAEAGEG